MNERQHETDQREGSGPVGLGGAIGVILAVIAIAGAYMAWDGQQRQAEEHAQRAVEQQRQEADQQRQAEEVQANAKHAAMLNDSRTATRVLVSGFSDPKPDFQFGLAK